MKVYVATKWSRRAEAQEVIATLRSLGHTITHDWTQEEDPPAGTPEADMAMFYAECAADDVNGVLDADAVIFLHDPAARGMYVEFGLALSAGVKAIVVDGLGDPTATCPVFYYLPEVEHVSSVEAALDVLDRMALAEVA